MNKLRLIFGEYRDELMTKVDWPKMEHLQSSTITVLVASLIVAIVIFGMDLGFNSVLSFIYQLYQ